MSTFLYNPDRKNKQDLIDEFVIRNKVLKGIFSDIQSGDMKYPEQHYLLLGPEGTGKTTLLLRLKYAVEDDPVLNKWLLPVIFREEQYHIWKLSDVWEQIATYLEDEYGFDGLTKEIVKHVQDKYFEENVFNILTKALDKQKKKIILLVDNIGDLLKRFDRIEVHRLRAILQTDAHIRLIATTPEVLIEVIDYTQPLFEFFKVIYLQGLDYDESVLLLSKLAALNNETKKIDRIIDKNPSRIETLRMLSGGTPRTIALLFQIFVDNEYGNALNDLEKVLDAFTPLYKHRMDDLPAQQQRIVDAVARNWEAISVKQLTERLRMESKIISAQLGQLEKNQVIEKRATSTKNHIYLLQERFFNIWYLMRYGRKQDRESVIWLVKFLEMWSDKKELEKRTINYISKIQKRDLDKRSEEFYAQTYSFFEKIKPEIKSSLKNNIPEHFSQLIDSVFALLITKHYQLALNTLNKSMTEDSEYLKHHVIFYITKYFTENKNEDLFISLGSEKKETVLKLITSLVQTQIKFEKTGGI
ncbi:hypothetical protein SAMN05518672_10645 [Chitinophaga sp. CF118]|uniref:ATP-binding protein n=1 Tax=Chitinophaga sp. CF118 TaxID=1884367 RepID=UPI0008EF00FF|nr:ATP-binding protein [Chitinophaga sp. CF118]SFE41380.1 hypothetical protein SAMN05518672_10645 [Chitinophaga sp. CF118]